MLFVIDFDGTLARHDTVDELLEKFADPAWADVEQDWQDDRITAVECMQRQIRMVKADRVTLENFFRAIEVDESFLPFHRHVSKFAKVAIVSGGLDHAIHVANRHAGLPDMPIYANRLHFVNGGIDISYPHLNAQCKAGNGICKCAVASELSGTRGGPVILVGDGKSDACLAHSADVVFAKDSLIKYCEEQNITHIPFDTFEDVLTTVMAWSAHLPQQAVSIA